MGLFDKFKKKEFGINDVITPCSGEMIPAKSINDPIFSQEILGKTIGIIPTDGNIYAPVSGKLEVMYPTGHAFGISREDGTSLLVHIGIDTVNLKGQGFKVFHKQGDDVKIGDKIVSVDLNLVKEKGYDTTTMLIITEIGTNQISYIDYQQVNKLSVINN